MERFNVHFRDFRVEGTFDETGKEGTGSLIVGVGLENCTFSGMEFRWGDAFCLNMNQCENVSVVHCDFRYIARDVVAVWGTPNVKVAYNTIIGNDDDSISINQARFESTNGVMRDGIIIVGNYLRDTGACKVQHAKNMIVSHNIFKLCKGGSAIYLEGTGEAQGQSDEYQSNVHGVIISDNIITDMISRSLSYQSTNGSINERVGIKINSKVPTASELEDPYEYMYSDTGASASLPVNENTHILVKNNIVRRTFSGGGVYTDFGFGKLFSRFRDHPTNSAEAGYVDAEGFANPAITDNMLQARCMEIRDSLVNAVIEGNFFQGSGDNAIFFNLALIPSGEDFVLRGVRVVNNTFRDFYASGVKLTDYSNSEQDIHFEGNVFDGDPFLRDSRNTTGGWSSSASCIGIDMSLVKGITIRSNRFKNLSSSFIIGAGTAEYLRIYRNIYEGEPSTSSNPRVYTASNRGLGIFPWNEDPEGVLDYIDSNPQSPTYLTRLNKSDVISSGDGTPPSDGYYFTGQTVISRRSVASSGKLLLGFRRATDGNTHTLNTDWIPMYATTS